MWKLGKTVDLHPGNDGFVHGATVEVASETGKCKRLRRPVQKLFPLEVGEASVTEKEEPARPVICSPERRRRRAAIEGEARRRQVDQYLDTVEDDDKHWSRWEDV